MPENVNQLYNIDVTAAIDLSKVLAAIQQLRSLSQEATGSAQTAAKTGATPSGAAAVNFRELTAGINAFATKVDALLKGLGPSDAANQVRAGLGALKADLSQAHTAFSRLGTAAGESAGAAKAQAADETKTAAASAGLNARLLQRKREQIADLERERAAAAARYRELAAIDLPKGPVGAADRERLAAAGLPTPTKGALREALVSSRFAERSAGSEIEAIRGEIARASDPVAAARAAHRQKRSDADAARHEREEAERLGALDEEKTRPDAAKLAKDRVRAAKNNAELERQLAREENLDFLAQEQIAVRRRQALQARLTERELSRDPEYNQAKGETAASLRRQRVSQGLAEEGSLTDADAKRAGELSARQRLRQANETAAAATELTPAEQAKLRESLAITAAAHRREAAAVATLVNADLDLAQAEGEAAATNRAFAANKQAAELGTVVAPGAKPGVVPVGTAVGDVEAANIAETVRQGEIQKQKNAVKLNELNLDQTHLAVVESNLKNDLQRAEIASAQKTAAAQQLALEQELAAIDAARVGMDTEKVALLQASRSVDGAEALIKKDALAVVARKLKTDQERAIVARELLLLDAEQLQISASTIATEKIRKAALDQAVVAELKRQSAAGVLGARQAHGQALRGAGTESTGDTLKKIVNPGFLAQKAVTTAGFAASGALLFGAVNTVKNLIEGAAELELAFSLVKAQFTATDTAGEFPRFRAAVLSISKETGTLAKDIVPVAASLKGAFGDAQVAIDQTTAGIKIAKVTGLELAEVIDSLTAISKSFGDAAGASFQEIGDLSLGLQDRFGVPAKELIKFLGDVAPVAHEAGLSIKEIGAIGAVALQTSGRGGAALAESYGRVLPAIQKNAAALINLQQNSNLKFNIQDLATGNTGKVFTDIIASYGRLSEAQKAQVVTILGQRKESQALIGVLSHGGKVMEETGRKTTDAGRLQKSFTEFTKSLRAEIDRLKANFLDFGDALFRAGISDFLKGLVTATRGLVDILGLFAHILGVVDGRITAVTFALAALYKLQKANKLSGLFGLGAVTGTGRLGGPGQLPLVAAPSPTRLGPVVLGGPDAGPAATRAGRVLGSPLVGVAALIGGLFAIDKAFQVKAKATKGIADAQTGYREAEGKKDAATLRAQLGDESYDPAKPFDERRKLVAERERAQAAVEKTKGSGRVRRERAQAEYQAKVAAVEDYDKAHPKAPPVAGAPLGVSNREKLQLLVHGGKTPAQIQADALQKKEAPLLKAQLKALAAAGQLKQKDVDKFLKGFEGHEDSDEKSNKAKDLIEQAGLKGPAAKAAIERAQAESAAQEKKATLNEQLLKDAEQATTASENALAYFEAGQASFTEYLAELQKQYDAARRLAAADPSNAENALDAAKKLKAISEQTSKQAERQTGFTISLAELAGTATPEFKVKELTKELNDPGLTDQDTRLKVAKDLVTAQRQVFDRKASLAETVQEEKAILEAGFVIPKSSRVEFATEQLGETKNKAVQEFFDANLKGSVDVMTFTSNLASSIIDGGLKNNAAIRAALEKGRMDLLLKYNALTNTSSDPDYNPDAGVVQGINAGLAGYDKALAGLPTLAKPIVTDVTDVVKGVQTDEQKKANAQREKQKKDNIDDLNDELYAAIHANNPELVAKRAIETADRHAAIAKAAGDKAGQIRAAIERVKAVRASEEATFDVMKAGLELSAAIADAAGDTVKSAEIALDSALKTQAFHNSQGAGDAQKARDAADVVRAQAGVRDAALSRREKDIDVALQLEKISVGQAITQLQALLEFPKITTDQTNEILLKIKGLKDSLNGDLQFNIPGELRIPTLYEARRINQTEGGSRNYQDNRNVQINFTAHGVDDANGVVDRIAAVFNGGERYGTRPAGY